MRLYLVALLVTGACLVNGERATSFQQTTPDYSNVIIRSLTDHQNIVAPKRLLRRYREDDEERAIGGGAISELATKLKGGTTNLAKKFVGINKYEDQLANKLDPISVYNALTAPRLTKLTADVEKINSNNLIKKVSVIGILTARYGDVSLAKALVTAKKEAGDPVLALQIQALRKDQMTRWLKGGNSVDDVFNLLKILDDGYHMIASRKLEVLDDYIKFVNPKKYDQTSLAKTLIKTYGSEDKVLKLLEAGKKHGHMANLLEKSLLSKWAGEGQAPITAFQRLKLHLSVDDAFAADNLNKIAKYVDDFNAKNSDTKKSTLKLYTNSFGDAAVAEKLVSAMDNSAKISIAMKLQTQQLQGWINSGKSLDNMFTILKVEKQNGATSWQLDVLEKFITSKSGEQNVIETLTKQFGNTDLATFLERSSKSTTGAILQEKQFTALIGKKIRPENFMSSVFKTVPASATREQKAIAAKNLASILERASKSTAATTLQKKQFIAWINRGVEPENFLFSVFKKSIISATKEQISIKAKFKAFVPILNSE
ncbi:Secreted RxLR effector peptide protein [Phytophthora palmivora]|uniref:Secreted RxLR effector peptide protein n=1 Tax=Phytophthora palmivora TaxID=4796 RepID=A0A2P4XVC0_9STRA|nr:Secreted RxLR effector peptide protein [Phytophthora palmivora]